MTLARTERPEAAPAELTSFLAVNLLSPQVDPALVARVSADPRFAAPLLDLMRFVNDDGVDLLMAALRVMHPEGSRLTDWDDGMRWLWSRHYAPPPLYAEFKAVLYERIDPAFPRYFTQAAQGALIRLDEIVWGGVRQDGIPPLRDPMMIGAAEADYLADSDIVFGLEIAGEARAYPKRILAWHEMFTATIGGVPLCGVYCTLCGTVILYETRVGNVDHALGTSGFLYRSNKLMYDRATQSLWSTLDGVPVVGPLVGQDIRLPVRPITTTSWGEWRRRHPHTTVLSPLTGHQRDYGEGVAYRAYFTTDELMFPVPSAAGADVTLAPALANKAEVFIPRWARPSDQPLAIAVEFLRQQSSWRGHYGGRDYVVLADSSDGLRAYAVPADWEVAAYEKSDTLRDTDGREWQITEHALVPSDSSLAQGTRLPAHNAFWFGWRAAFPDTKLIDGRGPQQ